MVVDRVDPLRESLNLIRFLGFVSVVLWPEEAWVEVVDSREAAKGILLRRMTNSLRKKHILSFALAKNQIMSSVIHFKAPEAA